MLKRKDEIYIIHQPRKIIFSLIIVDTLLEKGLDEKIHDNLGWLVNYSDIFFVFPEKHFPELSKINKRKFTSLYQGCGFIESTTKALGTDIIKTLLYDREILSNTRDHLGITISNISDLSNISEKQFNNIHSAISAGISRPVYTVRRLSSSEFHDIYCLGEINYEQSLKNLTGHTNIFKTIMKALWKKGNLTDDIGMYSTWHSKSPIMYFPKSAIESILRYRTIDKDSFNNWVETFINVDPRYLIASLVNTCGLDILNMEIDKVEV